MPAGTGSARVMNMTMPEILQLVVPEASSALYRRVIAGTRISWNAFRVFCWCCLVFLNSVPRTEASAALQLKVEMQSGSPQILVYGAAGSVCQIQWTENLSGTNTWSHLGELVITNCPSILSDPAPAPVICRFYRAVWSPGTNLVWIPPGSFTMGSSTNEALRNADEAQHSVTISQGFWMEKHLVTQSDYLSVVGRNPSYFTPVNGYACGLNCPVDLVNWFDASNYCRLRTQQEWVKGKIPTDCFYRLPTEAEWEYACRAGTQTAFYLGPSLHSGQANFDGQREYDAALGETANAHGVFLGRTQAVDSYAPNPFGLCDMIGNVWEWCQDWYGDYPVGASTDPTGPASGQNRIIRGGGCDYQAHWCRSANRACYCPTDRLYQIGFRVVLVQSP